MKSLDIGNEMKKKKKKKKGQLKLIISSATGNLVLSTIVIGVIPQLTEYSKTHLNIRKPLFLFAEFSILLCVVLFISVMNFVSEKETGSSKARTYKEHIRRAGTVAIFLFVFLILWQLLCGLIASLSYAVLAEQYGYESTKVIIDIVISTATIIIIPFLVVQTLGFSFSRQTAAKFFKHGPVGTWKTYITVLILEIIGVFTGTVLTIVLDAYKDCAENDVISILLFAVIGTALTYMLYYNFSTYKGRL